MIGVNLHIGYGNRQEMAHFQGACIQGLAFTLPYGNLRIAGGNNFPMRPASVRNVTPHHLGQVVPPENRLPEFYFEFRILSHRRGTAGWRQRGGKTLHALRDPDLIDAPANNKKQGWAGCEHQNYGRQSPFAAALRPVAIQWNNRRSSAARSGSERRCCLTATQSSDWRPGLRPTCCIARMRQKNVTNTAPTDTGPAFTHLKTSHTGPDIAFAAADLRCQTHLPKDPSCSAKS